MQIQETAALASSRRSHAEAPCDHSIMQGGTISVMQFKAGVFLKPVACQVTILLCNFCALFLHAL